MNGYEAYIKYLGIKRHFSNEKYDYFKYNGKVRATYSSYESRNDRYMFDKLSKYKNLEDHLVSNLYDKPDLWVGELITEEAVKNTNKFLKRKYSLKYFFESDITKLDEELVSNFIVTENQYPKLLRLYLEKEIDITTMVIFEELIHYIDRWEKRIIDPIYFPQIKFRIMKMKPFVNFEKHKYSEIIRNHFN